MLTNFTVSDIINIEIKKREVMNTRKFTIIGQGYVCNIYADVMGNDGDIISFIHYDRGIVATFKSGSVMVIER